MANESNAIIEVKGQAVSLAPLQEFSRQRLDYVRSRVISGKDVEKVDDDEFNLIILEMRHRRMDPLLGHCYVAMRDGVPKVEPRIDHYRVIGMQSGLVEAIAGPFWCAGDGVWREIWYPAEEEKPFPAAAKYEISRRGMKESVVAIVLMDSFSKQLQGKGDKGPPWKDFEVAAKLGICAERAAWRKAFPEFFGGLYGGEEMPEPEDDPPRRQRQTRERPPPRQEPRQKPPPANPQESEPFLELKEITKDWTKDQKRLFNEMLRKEHNIKDVSKAFIADQRRAANLAKTFLTSATEPPATEPPPEDVAAAIAGEAPGAEASADQPAATGDGPKGDTGETGASEDETY